MQQVASNSVLETEELPGEDDFEALSWLALCKLAQKIRGAESVPWCCTLGLCQEPWVELDSYPHGSSQPRLTIVLDPEAEARLPPPEAGEARYRLRSPIQLEEVQAGWLPAAARRLVETYLPYCLAAIHARRLGRCFAVSHFAQSLDGRIATTDGDSRWIGCPENLLHAHRMRALCESILIGSRTLVQDQPSLTVRHVPGSDPTRVVVGTLHSPPESLRRASTEPVVHLGCRNIPDSDFVRTIRGDPENGHLAPRRILEELFRQGLCSVYVEGGAETTSRFFEQRCIDILQLHFSPMIIGPGINSFSRPATEDIRASRRFDAHRYVPVGDGMMFVGWVGNGDRRP